MYLGLRVGLVCSCLALGLASAQAAEADATSKAPLGQPRGAMAGQAPAAGAGNAISDRGGQAKPSDQRRKGSDQPPLADPSAGATNAVGGGGFAFRVCNKSDDVARVAMTHRDVSGTGWRVQGWWKVDPDSCRNLGVFPHGWVYYYADADDGGSWGSGVIQKCVRYPGPFSRYENGESYSCRDDEQLKGFSGKLIESSISEHTWTLNP